LLEGLLSVRLTVSGPSSPPSSLTLTLKVTCWYEPSAGGKVSVPEALL
jgi:hypothetical protein